MTHSASTPPADAGLVADLSAAVDRSFPRTIAELSDLVRIPSVAWDGYDADAVQRSAEAVAELVRGIGGFDLVDIRRAPVADGGPLGQPAVIARRNAAPGAPTILLYAHHDVQPPGRDEDWDTPPYEPTTVGDRLYGRGAADDKAGVLAHVAALRAVEEVLGADHRLGVRLFIEGEEEFGSRSFAAFLAENADDLAADVIVVADSANWDEGTPALTTALRGNVTFVMRVRTLEHASHSGMFGGAVPDAVMAATRIANSFWDERGGVAIDGLVSTPGVEVPAYDEARLAEETGLLEGVSPIGDGPIPERLWYRPAVTVTGMDVPDVRSASNTLVPEVAVKVSVRTAPGQDSAGAIAAIRAHIAANTPFGARVELEDIDSGDPFLVTEGGAADAALRAMGDAWGAEPVRLGIGGSIPFISSLVERFPEAQILVTGVEDPATRAHSPNESLHLPGFRRSILAEALLLARLAEAPNGSHEA